MLGLAFHHLLWTVHTIRRSRVWHAIISLGHGHMMSGVECHSIHRQHTRLDDHFPWTAHTYAQCYAWHAFMVLIYTHCQMTSGVASQFGLETVHRIGRPLVWHAIIAHGKHTISQHWAWHTIIDLGQHTRLDDIRRGMSS